MRARMLFGLKNTQKNKEGDLEIMYCSFEYKGRITLHTTRYHSHWSILRIMKDEVNINNHLFCCKQANKQELECTEFVDE